MDIDLLQAGWLFNGCLINSDILYSIKFLFNLFPHKISSPSNTAFPLKARGHHLKQCPLPLQTNHFSIKPSFRNVYKLIIFPLPSSLPSNLLTLSLSFPDKVNN